MISTRRGRKSRRQAILGALLGFVLALPVAAAEPAAAAPQHGGGGFALLLLDYRQDLERLTGALRQGTAELAEGAAMAPAEMMGALQRVTAGTDPILLVAGLLGILAAGFLARHAVRRHLAGGAEDGGAAGRFGLRLARALYRALVDLVGLGAFALTALVLAMIFTPTAGPARSFILSYVTAALVALGVALAARFLLAPDAPGARLLPLGDRAARFLHRWLVTLAAVGSVAWLSAALLILSGMQLEAHLILALAVGTMMAALLVAMILAARPLVAATLLREDPKAASAPRVRFARSWHLFAILYLAVIWALWAASIVTRGPSSIWSAVASVLLAAALPLVDQAFGRGLAQVLGTDDAALPARQRTGAIMRRAFRIVLVGVAVVLLPSFWGIDVLRLLGAPGAGVFSHALFNILVTTLVAYVAWQLAETVLDRSLAAMMQRRTSPRTPGRAR
jgi:hypothetical protein